MLLIPRRSGGRMANLSGLWRDPITDRDQAMRITKVAAWCFGGLAILLLAPMLVDMARADHQTVVGDFAIIMLLALPSAVLLVEQSRGAAAVLLACSAVFFLASLAFAAIGMTHYGPVAMLGLPLCLAWVLLGFLAWRAMLAAFALHKAEFA
jgi:hypothetical protein